MDPNLFHIDGERLYEVLLAIVVLSFVLERALSLIFENKIFVEGVSGKGIKEVIAFGVAFAVCRKWDFDAVSVMLVAETTNGMGQAITAGVIAGGSKSSLKLFQDVMKTYSSAEAERREEKDSEKKRQLEGDLKRLGEERAKSEETLKNLSSQEAKLEARVELLSEQLANLNKNEGGAS